MVRPSIRRETQTAHPPHSEHSDDSRERAEGEPHLAAVRSEWIPPADAVSLQCVLSWKAAKLRRPRKTLTQDCRPGGRRYLASAIADAVGV
jgi:hypothetical protein